VVVAAIVAVTGRPAAAVYPEAELAELGLDSVLAMRLLDELEPRLGPVDVAALLPNLTTVGELVTHLEGVHRGPQGDAS
jgi:acyl carrier protein